MADAKYGPWLKLRRAKEHIADLNAWHRWWLRDPHPYQITREERGDAAYYHFQLVKPIPVAWGMMTGDAIHNLRSALDLLAYQLVIKNGRKPSEGTAFPIGRSAAHFGPKGSGSAFLKTIDTEAAKVIRALDPYQGGNDALWMLHRLDIGDKHHVLVPVTSALNLTVLKNWNIDAPPLPLPGPPAKALKDGDVLFGMPLDLDRQMKTYYVIEIALDYPTVLGKSFVTTLRELAGTVEEAIDLFRTFV